MSPTVRVAAAVILRDGRYLLRKRPPGGHLAGLWEFPGGKLEPNESWEDAVVREVREELGVGSRALETLGAKTFEYPERTVEIRFIKVEIMSPDAPRSLEADAPLLWATPREIANLPTPDANRELIAALSAKPSDAGIDMLWAALGIPLGVVLAGATWGAVVTGASIVGVDLQANLAHAFPSLVGGRAASFLALVLVFEALVFWRVFRKRS